MMIEFEADNLKEMPCQVSRQRYDPQSMEQKGCMYLHDLQIDGNNQETGLVLFEPQLKDPIVDGAGRIPVTARLRLRAFMVVQDVEGLFRVEPKTMRGSDRDAWYCDMAVDINGIYYVKSQTFDHNYCEIKALSVRPARHYRTALEEGDPWIVTLRAVLKTFLKKIQYNVHWIEFTPLEEVTP